MPCFHPRTAWFSSADGPERGRASFRASHCHSFAQTLPCGQCIGCRVRKQVAWGTRIYLASTLQDVNSFATFTYSDEHLPSDGGLRYEHMQAMFHRLRKAILPARFQFYCGSEYGGRFKRPHYHVVFLGWCPPDEVIFRRSGTDTAVVSPFLESVWKLGNVRATLLQPAQCLYVAKHNVDKLSGELADEAYGRVDKDTGECYLVKPPFARMSRGGNVAGRGGIGHSWLELFHGDIALGEGRGVRVQGREVPIPAYFLEYLKSADPDKVARLKEEACIASLTPDAIYEQTPKRLRVRERVALAGVARAREGRQL